MALPQTIIIIIVSLTTQNGILLFFCKIHTFLLVPEQYTWKIYSPPEWDSFSPLNPISRERECVYIALILLGGGGWHRGAHIPYPRFFYPPISHIPDFLPPISHIPDFFTPNIPYPRFHSQLTISQILQD